MVFSEDIKSQEKERKYNLSTDDSQVYIGVKSAGQALTGNIDIKTMQQIPFIKYSIRETDDRVKTAKLTLPHYFDLTGGVHQVKIVSKYHENFCGQVLSTDYTENSDGTYTYQLQDMSREYQSKTTLIADGTYNNYKIMQICLAKGMVGFSTSITSSVKEKFKNVWSGLRPIECYKSSLWGNVTNINFMEQKPKMIADKQTYMDIIRATCKRQDCDVYFNENGILQIEPISVTDWQNTGLYLTANETSKREFKFDITNAVTEVGINAQTKSEQGYIYTWNDIQKLELGAIFGRFGDVIDNPNEKTTTTTSSSSTSSTSSTSTNGNPFNSKAKKAYVDADSGSGDFKSSFIKELKNKGWTVKDGGTGPGTHYADYSNVSSDYACLVTIYNGFCAGTIKEAYSSTIQNKLKNKGVQLVVVFDTRNWTNPQGMKPYRNGDFTGYSAKRAWDDNFSSSDPSISNVADFFKKNNAVYCASPTVSGAIEQFVAGGYFKYKNK